ncbi:hypothetical protein WJX73_001732 [Symbiochloris irregularis]|uniref:Uncharacterized protein n=1 Tax=Symbiochloris irregularis TaxID=706552 RepID=A0AAW1P310_9CHLO
MASSAMQNCTSIVLTDQVLPALVQSAAAGVLVQHRDACSSVHSFVKRLYDADILARVSQEEAARWQGTVPRVTPVIMRRLVAGMVAFLPYSIADSIPDIIMAILKVAGQSGLAMLTQCIMTLPLQAASAAEQQKVLDTAREAVANNMEGPQAAHLDHALQDLADLCRRNPRALEAAERALVPEVFALPGSGLLPGTGMLEITVNQAVPTS